MKRGGRHFRSEEFLILGLLELEEGQRAAVADSEETMTIGSYRAFHPDGEVAVAKAARPGNHLQVLSSGATTSIEEVIAARGAPVWFQLYTRGWPITEALLMRAERAGSPVVVVTIDGGTPTNWETLARLRRTDKRQCSGCHDASTQDFFARRPNFGDSWQRWPRGDVERYPRTQSSACATRYEVDFDIRTTRGFLRPCALCLLSVPKAAAILQRLEASSSFSAMPTMIRRGSTGAHGRMLNLI
jgi:hypothetical protein